MLMKFRKRIFPCLALIVALGALLVGCGANQASVPATRVNAVSPTPSPDNSKIKTAKGRGIVTKIDLKLVSVELNHEDIPGIMPAMIMEFYVKEKSELEVLKVGDQVDFVLEDNAGQERIISISKSKPE